MISAIIGSLLGSIVVARQCALAAVMQDFSKGYAAPGRNSESGKWLMRLVAHFRHPPMRSLRPTTKMGENAVSLSWLIPRRRPNHYAYNMIDFAGIAFLK